MSSTAGGAEGVEVEASVGEAGVCVDAEAGEDVGVGEGGVAMIVRRAEKASE